MLLVVNLQFSEFSENGISDLIVHLHNSESVFWPIAETSLNLSWPCPVPRKNRRIVIQSFGDLSVNLEKLTDWYDPYPKWPIGILSLLNH